MFHDQPVNENVPATYFAQKDKPSGVVEKTGIVPRYIAFQPQANPQHIVFHHNIATSNKYATQPKNQSSYQSENPPTHQTAIHRGVQLQTQSKT